MTKFAKGPLQGVRLLSILLLEAAAIASAFMWVMSFRDDQIPGCTEGGGCQQVLTSQWAFLLGQPVSLFGFLFYSGLLGVVVIRSATGASAGRALEVAGSLTVVAIALWFTGVQLFILQAFCPWCSAIHLIASAGAILLVADSPQSWKSIRSYGIPIGLVLVVGFMQAMTKAPERVLTSAPERVMEITGEGQLALHGGNFLVDPKQIPMIGAADSPKLMVAMTDYTCPHCLKMQRSLREMHEASAGDIGVVLVPAWRDSAGRTMHRIMLSLWKADPVYYEQLTAEMEQGTLSAEPSLIMSRISERIGDDFHRLAWENAGWLDDTMALGRDLLATNDSHLKVSTLPQFIVGGKILQGSPSVETISKLLDGEGGGPSPKPEVVIAKGAPAQIKVEQTTVKIGEVVRGDQATGRFEFANSGDAPLTVLGIKASCGCVAVEGWEQTVAPGEMGSFDIRFDASHQSGNVLKHLTVTTNADNVKGGVVTVGVEANVWLPVKLSSYNASFGVMLKGKANPQPKKITITVTDEDSTQIGEPLCSDDYFDTKLEEIDPGKEYLLTVSIPHLEEKSVGGKITIPLGNPRLKELTIPVYAKVADEVEVNPESLLFPVNRGDAPSSRIITIFCHDKFSEFKIDSVEILGSETITATIKPSQTYRWHQIIVTIPAKVEGAVSEAEGEKMAILIKTNHPSRAEIRVPIKVPGLGTRN
jgi:uncharacterized membrane protein